MRAKFMCLLLGSVFIAGCASTPFDYEDTARRAAYASLCQREGLISQSEFSNYTSYQLVEFSNQYTHDRQRLQARYLDLLEQARRSSINTQRERDQVNMNCAQISTVAKRVDPNNAAQRQSTPAYQYKPPTTTNCMTTYGWTRCTTN
jgi:hypothetical protein